MLSQYALRVSTRDVQDTPIPLSDALAGDRVDEPRAADTAAAVRADVAYSSQQEQSHFIGKLLGQLCDGCDAQRTPREVRDQDRRRGERKPQRIPIDAVLESAGIQRQRNPQ